MKSFICAAFQQAERYYISNADDFGRNTKINLFPKEHHYILQTCGNDEGKTEQCMLKKRRNIT